MPQQRIPLKSYVFNNNNNNNAVINNSYFQELILLLKFPWALDSISKKNYSKFGHAPSERFASPESEDFSSLFLRGSFGSISSTLLTYRHLTTLKSRIIPTCTTSGTVSWVVRHSTHQNIFLLVFFCPEIIWLFLFWSSLKVFYFDIANVLR
jgi:hypothetical protein